jgi:hypothetical protein
MTVKKEQITINTATDTGFCFEAGNIAVIAPHSLAACIPSTVVALACVAARAAHEHQKTSGSESSSIVPAGESSENLQGNVLVRGTKQIFSRMVDNPGVGVEVSAVGLAVASIVVPLEAIIIGDTQTLSTIYEWGRPETILGSFAVANALNGSSSRLSNTFVQNAMRMAGTAIAAAGVMMTTGEPLSVIDWSAVSSLDVAHLINTESFSNPNNYGQLLLVGAAFQSMWQTLKHVPASGLLQPQLMFAGACAANAVGNAMHGNVAEAVANTIWTVAFISLDAVFKNGGLYQKYLSGRTPAP